MLKSIWKFYFGKYATNQTRIYLYSISLHPHYAVKYKILLYFHLQNKIDIESFIFLIHIFRFVLLRMVETVTGFY